VKNDMGSIVVSARLSEDSHPGLAFMRNSPWSNQLLSDATCEASIPGYKGIKAAVQPAEASAAVTDISEILSRIKG